MTVCNNKLGGDPIPGERKTLKVIYSKVAYYYAGQTYTITKRENEGLSLPP